MRRTAFGVSAIVALLGAFFMTLSPHTAGPTVRMGASYAPAVVRVPGPGSAVTFSNRSKATHTATCVGCGMDTGDVQPGLEKTLTFGRPGTFVFADRYGNGRVTVVVPLPPSPSPNASS